MFNIFKKFNKNEDENVKETFKEEIPEQKQDISQENPEFDYEEALDYVEDKIDNYEQCEEALNYIEDKLENPSKPKKRKNKILYYYNQRKNKLEMNENIQQKTPEEELDKKLEELEEPIKEENVEKIEEAFHYFEHVIEEHEKQEEQEIQEEQEEIILPQEKSLFGISFSGLKQAVSKTSEFFNSNIFSLSDEKQEIDDDLLDDMEERFIRADIGVNTTVYIIERLRERKKQIAPSALRQYLKDEFAQILKASGSNKINLNQGKLNIILITGVNGAGKTTLIGKLAYRYKQQGKKVLVAAGDTFRAAAEEQLEIWANRANAEIIRQDGADPASVVYDSIKRANEGDFDILLIDTAGRLHNKFNLMEELRKIKKVIDKEAPDSLSESLLVLDATTGQNGLKQAEVFKEAVNITGVGLTKLDGTAKGGVILGIAKELNLPVKLIGVGEKMEDLKDFNAEDFVEALF